MRHIVIMGLAASLLVSGCERAEEDRVDMTDPQTESESLFDPAQLQREGIEGIEVEMEQMEERFDRWREEAGERFRQQMDPYREQVLEYWQQLQDAGEEGWEQARDRFDAAILEMEEAWGQLREELSAESGAP